MTTPTDFFGHPLVHALGWTLLHFLWQGTLAALVLWIVLRLLNGRSSQARYGAACFALALLVAMPLMTFARIALAGYKTRTEIQESAVAIDVGMMLQVGIGEPVARWPAKMFLSLDRWTPWILAAWLVGAVFFVVRLNLGLIIARRLQRTGTQAPPPGMQHLFDRLKLRLGVKRAVKLLHSARVQVPTVIGWLHPVVLIPVSCLTGLSTLQIEAIFCHELAHVRRHDYLVSVLQSVAEALLFYHPAVWWVSRQIRRERECCCDEVAVANGGDVLAYAKALSYLEERRAAFPEFVLGANGGVLTMRIKRLLGCKEDAHTSQLAALTLMALIGVVLGSYVATVARAQPKSAQPAPSSAVEASATYDASQTQATGLAQPQAEPTTAELQPLPPEYKNWLQQDTVYLITPEERAAFLRLTRDEDRDQFIAQFWERRNPTPGSTINSFKEQHYARLAYANQHFAADVPGWQTDRGRVYIMNGKPESIDAHPSGGQNADGTGLAPFEVWHYPSVAGAGQSIDLRFVDDCMCGKYRLVPSPRLQANSVGPIRVSSGVIAENLLATGIMASRNGIYQPQSAASGQAVQPEGEITGIIVDPTGALVPRASVRAISTDKRVAITKATDNLGAYSLAPLPPGKYNLEVLAPGFQRLIQQDISIDGPQKIVLNLKLKVGAVAQNLTVAVSPSVVLAAPPPVEVPKAKPGSRLRVSAGTMAGNIVSKVDPVYPADAKANHVQGVVVLHATISKTGSIENVEVVSGPPALLVSAIDAVRQWKYKPYLLNGEPTAVETTININYTFADPAEQQGQTAFTDASTALRTIGNGVSTPTLIYQVKPEMTPEAKSAKFMGIVLVTLIVDAEGTPQNVHVLRGVGMGLDEKAIEAVKQYKFKPAMEGGKAVPVQMNAEVNFQIF